MDELYDLRADPYELENVIHKPDFQETLRALQGALVHLAATAAPERNP